MDTNLWINREACLSNISRQSYIVINGIDYVCRESILKKVRRLPAIEAQPKIHAKWQHIGGDEWSCTACGNVISTEGSWEHPYQKHCDECGAKMDGGDPHV